MDKIFCQTQIALSYFKFFKFIKISIKHFGKGFNVIIQIIIFILLSFWYWFISKFTHDFCQPLHFFIINEIHIDLFVEYITKSTRNFP